MFAGAGALPAGFAGPAPAAAGADGMFPNENDRLMPRFTAKKLGPNP